MKTCISNIASDTPGVWTETKVFQVYVSETSFSMGLMVIRSLPNTKDIQAIREERQTN